MEKTTWAKLSPAARAELEVVVRSTTTNWHSQLDDVVGFWLLALLACIGGLGTSVWYFTTEPGSLAGLLSLVRTDPLAAAAGLAMSPPHVGTLAALVIGIWVALTWKANLGRRGLASTADALIVVRGKKLLVIPRSSVAGAERRTIGQRGRRFTVVTLKMKDGRTRALTTTGRWADAAMVGLPPM